MQQAIPSVLLYSQALALLQNLQDSFTAGNLQSPSDIATTLRSILTNFEITAGQPLLDFELVAEGEPPLSAKMNNVWNTLQYDVSILQNQIDILQAAALFTNNFLGTEILQAQNQNSALANKLDTLQLYASNTTANNLIIFSDTFGNSQTVDLTMVDPSMQAAMQDGFLRLGNQGQLINLSSSATISILSTSNGFSGNNQEIEDPTQAPVDPTSNMPVYTFVAQNYRAGDVTAISKGDPSQWFEYEYYYLNPTNKLAADNYNFVYQIDNTANSSTIDWSIGPPDGTLELDLQFDLGSVQPINYIEYTPYGLTANQNNPVLIDSIQTSEDGTTWTPVNPAKVWVGTNTNNKTLGTAPNLTIGTVIWSFEQRNAEFIQFSLRQSQPINVNVGHLYYLENSSGQRVEGPIPSVNNPAQYYDPSYSSTGTATQYREYWPGQRWAIGIQDIQIQQINYQTDSIMITKPLDVGGVVNRVALDADVWVPSDFDPYTNWVKFFVSPDNGQSWFPIARIEDTTFGISQVLAFNDPLPVQFQEPGVAYYNVSNAVTSLRFKIELSSPNTQETPLVRSYSLKVTKQ